MTGLATIQEKHFVDRDGFVFCPRRGTDVDVERCLACPWFEGIDNGRHGTRAVVCDVQRAWLGPLQDA